MNKQPTLGVDEEMILSAEEELGIRFPEDLRDTWKTYNCNEVSGGWRIFPIFDPENPRKTCESVNRENLKSSWGQEVMSQGLVSIADNGTGDQLVLKVVAGQAGADVFLWHHETRKLTPWKPGIALIKAGAAKARDAVLTLRQRFRHAG